SATCCPGSRRRGAGPRARSCADMPHRRFRAPERNGEVLVVPDFAGVPALVEENRRRLDRADVTVGGLPLRELRALARREVLEAAARYTGVESPATAVAGLSVDAPL